MTWRSDSMPSGYTRSDFDILRDYAHSVTVSRSVPAQQARSWSGHNLFRTPYFLAYLGTISERARARGDYNFVFIRVVCLQWKTSPVEHLSKRWYKWNRKKDRRQSTSTSIQLSGRWNRPRSSFRYSIFLFSGRLLPYLLGEERDQIVYPGELSRSAMLC